MIMCHPVLRLGTHHAGYENDLAYFFGDVIFGDYIGVAHAFMFAMGVGIVFSKKNRASDLVKRGVWLFVLGYILNFLRYGLFALADGIIEGEFFEETIDAFVCQDILHFAGLALIAAGVFKAMKLNEIQSLGIGVGLSIAGSFVAFSFQSSSRVINYLLGYFIVTTEDDSCFVFFNWYIFVAVGILFGSILKKSADLDGLYKKVLTISFPIMVLYIVMTVVKGVLFLTKDGWYYAVSPLEAMGLLSIDFVMIGAFYFLLKRIDEAKVAPFITMSRNLTKIYIIHWCIIGFVDSIFCYLLEIVFPYTIIYIFAFALIFVSYWIARWWEMKMRAISPGMTSTES
jgi:hypothetical protein